MELKVALEIISIAFVDDHPILLSGIEHVFSENSGFRTIGTGTCAQSVLDIADRDQPDVIVADLNMPGNVLEAISKLVQGKSKTKVLIFTAVTSVDHAVAALEAGASGYLLKGSSENELIRAIRSVHDGETYISPSFGAKVIAGLRSASVRRASAAALRLSNREVQVLRLLLWGKTNQEIADSLSLTEKTVKHYMRMLMQRLNARNRIEVVLAAQELGIEASGQKRPSMN
ncbi:response regulator [Pseudorhodobacter wandonensis]|uniref:response regulator n=1 Tax=Pseudorhodobacter wandonensis TaxID=1120568 RepID=UPI00067D560A|nr:response regulator transcription factor [Pseudorhodobacter wandonensis]